MAQIARCGKCGTEAKLTGVLMGAPPAGWLLVRTRGTSEEEDYCTLRCAAEALADLRAAELAREHGEGGHARHAEPGCAMCAVARVVPMGL